MMLNDSGCNSSSWHFYTTTGSGNQITFTLFNLSQIKSSFTIYYTGFVLEALNNSNSSKYIIFFDNSSSNKNYVSMNINSLQALIANNLLLSLQSSTTDLYSKIHYLIHN